MTGGEVRFLPTGRVTRVVQTAPPPGTRPDYDKGGHWERETVQHSWTFHLWPVEPAEGDIPRHGSATPQRITQALDLRMFDGPWVDLALGVEEPAVDEWEAGSRRPTEMEIRRLATLTHVMPAFFYEPPVDIGMVFMCGALGLEGDPSTCPSCGSKRTDGNE